jgi:hypothetical protein
LQGDVSSETEAHEMTFPGMCTLGNNSTDLVECVCVVEVTVDLCAVTGEIEEDVVERMAGKERE